uniref:Uncharacterized protein n=1 Tax=viral metagenome TaxID=1070528 RepID=A0A6C0AFJ4_9ZZZZ
MYVDYKNIYFKKFFKLFKRVYKKLEDIYYLKNVIIFFVRLRPRLIYPT